MAVTGIILAAGRGSRMGGGPKQLLPLAGRPLLQHVLDAAAAAGLGDLVLVLGDRADVVAAALCLPPGTRVVVNQDHRGGQSTSLRAGLAAASEASDAAVVLLGDQPGVRPGAIRAVAAAGGPDARIVRAAYRGRRGHPVLLARSLWPELARLAGDQGARALMARHAGEVVAVEVGGDPPDDVDTMEAYARLLAGGPPTGVPPTRP